VVTVSGVAEAMQTVLTVVANDAARERGFVRRRRKLSGAKFAQALVFGWLANPKATLEELAQTAAAVGVCISPQGLDQRFTESAAGCLEQILRAGVRTMIAADSVAIPLLQRFKGVYLQDSSSITLPEALSEVWRGCGGSRPEGTSAALKIQVRLDLSSGELHGPLLQHGRQSDRTSPLQGASLPAGALLLADLGYFSLQRFKDLSVQGGYWLSRLQAGTAVFDENGKRWHLVELLRARGGNEIDIAVVLGVKQRLPCRLLAVRVPQEVTEQRRRRIRREASRRGQTPRHNQLALAEWTVYITNVPRALLSLPEAMVLGRVRWQIELLFKLWKSHGRIDEWRSAKPWHILCEVYAKLLAMLVQHWLLLVGCWQYPDRSLHKAAQTVRKHALHLASTFGYIEHLTMTITTIKRCLATGCRINKRRAMPHTYQLLLHLTEGGLS